MDYIKRKFKESRRMTTPKMIITSDSSSDNDIHRLASSFQQFPHHSYENINRHCESDHSNISQSSHSSDDSERLRNTSIKKMFLNRPLLVRRYHENDNDAQFTDSAFAMDSLYWHNVLRLRHGSPPLSLSNQLCMMAQYWSNHLAHTDTYQYRNDRDIGENLLSKWTYHAEYDPPGEETVKYWYNEIETYNFNIDPSVLHTQANHFTQIVWKSTKEFGIGKAHTRSGKLIIVANYRPAGNISDHFHENVFPVIPELVKDERKCFDTDCDKVSVHSQSPVSH